MSSTVTVEDLCAVDLSLLCRGCLTSSGEMRNMVEWGLVDDFYRLTNIQVDTVNNPSLLLCSKCEDVIYKWRSFKASCQASDAILKSAIVKRQTKGPMDWNIASAIEFTSNHSDNTLFTELTNNGITVKITAPNMDSKIQLPCHYCQQNFIKRTDLTQHLVKHHKVSKQFTVELRYHCNIQDCSYYVNSGKDKYFTSRKYLNQHTFKVHRDKIHCKECGLGFFNEVDFQRHLNTCNCTFVCQVCGLQFNTREKSMVHLMRKHPDVHAQYKNEKSSRKRSSDLGSDPKKVKTHVHKSGTDTENMTGFVKNEDVNKLECNDSPNIMKLSSEDSLDAKKVKTSDETGTNTKNRTDFDKNIGFEKLEFLCDSPKRSFATQTLEFEKHIRNDVTLPSWQAERTDETKKDETATQTVFEDLLSLKSNISEEETIFSDAVSLSDIQTQTFPFEFGLSRSNKETLTDTQSPDLSIKETQTCICMYESPKPNFRCVESVSSSPSTFSVLTSTETQTLDFDLLGFTSAETQTCFDELQKQL